MRPCTAVAGCDLRLNLFEFGDRRAHGAADLGIVHAAPHEEPCIAGQTLRQQPLPAGGIDHVPIPAGLVQADILVPCGPAQGGKHEQRRDDDSPADVVFRRLRPGVLHITACSGEMRNEWRDVRNETGPYC